MTEKLKDSHEEAPTLPEDANEAGELLQRLWLQRSQSEETPWNELPEDEQKIRYELEQKKRESEPNFTWLAEIFDSEMGWGQGRIETNYGKVFWFKFGYGEKHDVPRTFVFYSDQDTYTDGLIITGEPGNWKKKTLREFKQEYDNLLFE